VPCARGRRFAGRSRMNTSTLISHGIRLLLPFAERVAGRMLVAAASTFIVFVTIVVLAATGIVDVHGGTPGFALVALSAVAFVTTFIGFLVLLTGYSRQSGGGIGST